MRFGSPRTPTAAIVVACVCLGLLAGCEKAARGATDSSAACDPAAGVAAELVVAEPPSFETEFGIRIEALLLTAGGSMLDLRLRVLDAERARRMLSASTEAALVHKATGERLTIAIGTKVGPLRQVTDRPKEGVVYFVLFANPDRLVKRGDQVTVVAGEVEEKQVSVQ